MSLVRKTRARLLRLEQWTRGCEVLRIGGARRERKAHGLRVKRICHFEHLFVDHDGHVCPCCLTWEYPYMRIGHVSDTNLLERIKGFYAPCHCERFILRKAGRNDRPAIRDMNLELSLACQGKCVMCCVGAPSWRGAFNNYEHLTRLIDVVRPKAIIVQGGEVLVQPRSLDWIERVKDEYGLSVSVVTNGCLDLDRSDRVERLFASMMVSIVGFQPETYRRIMGLDLEKTIAFVEELNRRASTRVSLKYLVTPLNMHEAVLFLRWAIALRPHAGHVLLEVGAMDAIRLDTTDHYWAKIADRTARDLRALLAEKKEWIIAHNVRIYLTSRACELFGIQDESWDEFLARTSLQENVSRFLL